MLLAYLNIFAEEMSKAHSEKSLKNLSFLWRQCVVLCLVGHSLAEYHKKFISLVGKHLPRDFPVGT